MKIITTIVKWTLLFTLAFLNALVAFKYYEWFGPETGLDLPKLTYLNILAIMFIVNKIINMSVLSTGLHSATLSLQGVTTVDGLNDLEERSNGLSISLSIAYHIAALLTFGIGYLIYVILY